ncbi:hypothetical protein MMC07_000317 [Pseudocyphellaria aurata]|nr:hypothetical protein [Pseudocyphellaria aurata]
MLPTAVQKRLPRFSSFRLRNATYNLVEAAPELDRHGRAPDFNPGCVRNDSVSSSSRSPSPPNSRSSSSKLADPDWKYINQGRNLLCTAISEAHSSPQSPNSLAFSRQVYIHGLIYLLQALPPDLTVPETTYIRDALPSYLYAPNPEPEQKLIAAPPLPARSPPQQRPPLSLLHRLLASIIIHLFLLLQLILPYLKLFLRRAYQYERTHHMTEWILVTGIEAADLMGKRGADVLRAVLWRRDRRVSDLLVAGMLWWVDGIWGGVQEGLGVGMARIGWEGGVT